MEAIGIEVGFANRMSFYRAFKQIKGVSVGEWANLSWKFKKHIAASERPTIVLIIKHFG